MKKKYLLACILLLVSCGKNKTETESFSNTSSSIDNSSSSSLEESSSELESSNSSSSTYVEVIEECDYYGFLNASYDGVDYSRRVAFNFKVEDLIMANNSTYNRDLAKLSILLANDVDGCFTFVDGKNDKRPYLMNQLDMDDYTYIDLFDEECLIDPDDRVGFSISHKKISYQTNDYEVILTSIRGTSNDSEWRSDVDIGADIPLYYELTGEHPDWKDKENFKSFDVTSNRTAKAIEEYVSDYIDKDANKVILISGHSRGGAIANIVGKLFEEKEDYKSFSYCFASPNTTTSSTAKDYKTIFNIENSDDIVCAIPPSSLGFTLYGTTIEKSVSEDYQEIFNNIYGFDDVSANGKNLAKLLKPIASSREELFEIDYEHTYTQTFISLDKANIQRSKDIEKYKEKGLDKLVEVSLPEKGTLGLYQYKINISPQFVLQTIKNAIGDSSIDLDSFNISDYKDITSNSAYTSIALCIANGINSRGIIDSHMPTAYYLIVDSYK